MSQRPPMLGQLRCPKNPDDGHTQPTLNRLADERATALPEHEVDAAIAETLRREGSSRGGFARVHAAPDDPTAIDEATAMSLVILGPGCAHSGRVAGGSTATEAVSDSLLRCRSAQRRFRNTLIFVAADEAGLATAREVAWKALAWEAIEKDSRLKAQLTGAQAADVTEKARTHREAATKAVRSAWSHIIYPEKSDTPGKPFDLNQTVVSSRDRPAIPEAVYAKAKGDGVILERLGAERLWLALKPIWPTDRPHLSVAEAEEWFASYVYLPKTRDRVVLETAIGDAVSQLDPKFGYAEGYDVASSRYVALVWAKAPPEFIAAGSLLVSEPAAQAQTPVTAAGVAGPTRSDPSGQQVPPPLLPTSTKVAVRVGDGSRGWPEHAPFDKILVTAAARQVPGSLVEQLKPGGRMVIPIGPAAVQHLTLVSKDAGGQIELREVLPVRFTQLETGQ